MLSSDATSEDGKKKSLLPNVSFLDDFSQSGDQKNMSYYLYKGTFGKKMAPNCHISRKKCLSSPYLYRKKRCHAIHTKVFMGKRWSQVAIFGGENVLISDI
jgi:hypothetical protein